MSKSSKSGKRQGNVEVSPKKNQRLERGTFPGPADAHSPLRVAIDRKALSDVIAHANDHLDVEICGVLIGQAMEDERGPFVRVDHIIRGHSATNSSTSVTFTHETWEQIHQTLEQRHPKRQIVGWYHTHPGFGVTFSEMDLFIQRNFFPSPTQVALVFDPLSSKIALCYNAPDGIEYLETFWADGRKRQCETPEKPVAADQKTDAGDGFNDKRMEALDRQINSMMQSFDDLQNRVTLYLYVLVTVISAALIVWMINLLWPLFIERPKPPEPPELQQYVDVPVIIDNQPVMLGIEIKSWRIPDSMDLMEQVEDQIYAQIEAILRPQLEGLHQQLQARGIEATPIVLPQELPPGANANDPEAKPENADESATRPQDKANAE